MYVEYGEKELSYLKKKDARLSQAIEKIGHIDRLADTDVFSAVMHHIIGQQISTAAQQTIWKRLKKTLQEVNASTVGAIAMEALQKHGLSYRKAAYMKEFAQLVSDGRMPIHTFQSMCDEDVIAALVECKGIGVWTAEMILLFCLQRQDVLSYGDLAIHRGMRMLYHHQSIDKALFAKYKKRYSPYGSIASLYLWAIAGNAIEGMKDFAPLKKKKEKGN